jgi:predicted Fe-Mo cluster-binding NifX family protein
MLIAIPCDKQQVDSTIAPRFARSRFFAVVDTNNSSIKYLENPFFGLEHGVGKNILRTLTDLGIELLVAHELGLKAQQMACQNKIQILLLPEKIEQLNQIIKFLKIAYHE